MKVDEFNGIAAKLGETMNMLEDLETELIAKFGDRCHTAVWMRLTSCYLALTGLQFSSEYQERFGGDQGGWSLTE